MTWFNANEHLAIDAAARHRVQELHSAASLAVTPDGAALPPNRCRTNTLRAKAAFVLGLVGLVNASCVGCASGTRSVAADPSPTGVAPSASPKSADPQIPVCRGMGSYNRAANLCVSEGA